MSKPIPVVTVRHIRNILRNGEFFVDLGQLQGKHRFGYNDKRKNGRRIKLLCRLSEDAEKWIRHILELRFDWIRAVTVKPYLWKRDQWGQRDRQVTAIYITNKQ